MKKILLLLSVVLLSCQSKEKSKVDEFWEALQAHCGKSYEGRLAFPENDADFAGKKLVMHVRQCSDNQIKIPFMVGDDRSRTWVFTRKGDRIELKHDHRHEDGTSDEVTMYGGTTNNTGQATIQVFPADEQTTSMLPMASTNVWWTTLDHKEFTYNLRRIGSDRLFTVVFDLSKTVDTPDAPWGWEE